jgi:osmotically inducible protein OsmC
MPTRKADAAWRGDLKGGSGTLSLGSGTFKDQQYSFSSRFEEGAGTNPEELLGAAHAGCFTMWLANQLSEAGFTPEEISTEAAVQLEGTTITSITLTTRGKVPGIDQQKFVEFAEAAKTDCIISRAIAVPDIRLDATLL